MNKLSSKISSFIAEHHVLSLSTCRNKNISSCSVFYTFNEENNYFIFASDEKTEHIQNILENRSVSCAIHLETKEIGTIRGLQIKAEVFKASKEDKKAYIKAFPYALVMKDLQVWKIEVNFMKFTDNRLGFGKKESWGRS